MISDLRFCLRQLWKTPAFSLIAILCLALGIGATTALFSVINSTLFRSGPYPQAGKLVFITPEKISGGITDTAVSAKQFAEWEQQSHSFAGLAAYDWLFAFLVHSEGNESIEGMLGSSALFEVLGVQPLLGRVFTVEEKTVEAHPVVILGYEFWQRRFGGDPAIIGQTVRFARFPPLTVVGVMPRGLRFLPSRKGAQGPNYNVNAFVDFWVPGGPRPTVPGATWNVVGRLKPDVDLAQAQAEMKGIAANQALSDSAGLSNLTTSVARAQAVLTGDIRRVVLPLFGAVCFVLLIACANVTGLLFVRGLGRQKELAIRAALGATRPRLLRLALTESLLLALAGGALGALLAFGLTKILIVTAANSIPRIEEVSMDFRTLGFAVGISLLTGLASGVVAAWQTLRPDVNQALKTGAGKSGQGLVGRRLLGSLVAGEVALTLTLLIGAGLMIQTMVRLTRLNPGYETHQIVTMVVTSLAPDVFGFHKEALRSVSALPGVTSAAFVWGLPLTGNQWRAPILIEGRPPPLNPQDRIVLALRSVTPDYFKVMGVALKAGRLIGDQDQAKVNPVVVINEAMARRYFPNEDPLGKHLNRSGAKPMEIIGVVTDFRSKGLTVPVEEEIYLPFFQAPAFSKHLIVRTATEPLGLVAAVQRELRRIDPGVVIEKVKTMDRIRDDSVSAQHFAMVVIVGFAIAALVLAIIGIYGVMSYSVVQRSHEIGVRLAIGAQKHHILRLIVGRGLFLALIGVGLGLTAAFALTRALHSLLFEINATDPLTFIAMPVILVLVAITACWLPARRATKIDPLIVIRSE